MPTAIAVVIVAHWLVDRILGDWLGLYPTKRYYRRWTELQVVKVGHMTEEFAELQRVFQQEQANYELLQRSYELLRDRSRANAQSQLDLMARYDRLLDEHNLVLAPETLEMLNTIRLQTLHNRTILERPREMGGLA